MRIQQQAIAQFQRLKLQQAGGKLCFVGQATGSEQFIEAAFAQLIGTGGHLGGTGQTFGRVAAGLPGGEGGISRVVEGGRLGDDFLQRAGFAVAGGIGLGVCGITG